MASKLLVMGRSGTGKTTFANFTFHNSEEKRRIAIVPMGHDKAVTGNVRDLITLIQNNLKSEHGFEIWFTPAGKWDYQEYEYLCAAIMLIGDCVLYIDEINLVQGTGRIGENHEDLIRRGRHKKISLIYTTQRPQDLNTVIKSQMTDFVTFRQRLTRDITVTREIIGDEIGDISKLEIGEFFWLNDKDELKRGKTEIDKNGNVKKLVLTNVAKDE